MRSIEKLSQEEKELDILIGSIKNVLTDVPYDFMYSRDENDTYDCEETDDEYDEYYD